MWNQVISAARQVLASPALACFVALVTGAVLIPSRSVLEKLGIDIVISNYRSIFGFAFLVACAALLIHGFNGIRKMKAVRDDRRERIHRLSGLSSNEGFILAYCIAKQQQSVFLPMPCAAAQAMTEKGLIEPARLGSPLIYSYTIRDDIWQHIRSWDFQQRFKMAPEDFLKTSRARALTAGQQDWRQLSDAFSA